VFSLRCLHHVLQSPPHPIRQEWVASSCEGDVTRTWEYVVQKVPQSTPMRAFDNMDTSGSGITQFQLCQLLASYCSFQNSIGTRQAATRIRRLLAEAYKLLNSEGRKSDRLTWRQVQLHASVSIWFMAHGSSNALTWVHMHEQQFVFRPVDRLDLRQTKQQPECSMACLF
jgi:hypothetical protein